METAKLIVDLIGKVIWPIIVMIVILIFYKHIIKLLPHIKKFKAAGVEFTIDKIEGIVEETLESKFKLPDKNFQKIIDQEDDTVNMEKIDAGNNTLLAFTARVSHIKNEKYNIYFDPAERRNNIKFKYIGLYVNREICAVGKLNKIVYCNYNNGQLVKTGEKDDVSILTPNEYKRIKEIIEDPPDDYNLKEGIKFYLVDKFYETSFVKSSAYALRAKKYIWLDEIEGFKEGMTGEELAKLLNGKEWE